MSPMQRNGISCTFALPMPLCSKSMGARSSDAHCKNLLLHLHSSGWETVKKLPSLPPVGLETGTLSASIIWTLWISRNQLIFQKRDFTPKETVLKAITDVREWMLAQPTVESRPSKPVIGIEPNPRRPTSLSVFTDAAWNPSTRAAGLGWIVDDLVSSSSSSHSVTADHVSSTFIAEALAVRSAMNFALLRGFASISIFSDAKSLIDTINRKEMKIEIFGILQDIYFSALSFMSICYISIPRAVNDKADSIAK